jgi:pilus assembly protein CpaE
MKSMIRVVLVDPIEASRQALERLLGAIDTVWLAEVCSSYEAAGRSATETPPDLMLVVLDSDTDQALALIHSVARSAPRTVVLPASHSRDSDLILKTIRAGAREFLPLPTNLEEMLASFERLVPTDRDDGNTARRKSHVIAITGASGGVGCTTLAVNLATTLAADPEQTVVLADFDLLLGAVDTCLDMIPEQTLLEVAQSVDRLDLTLLKRTLGRHESGLYVLPHPLAMEDVHRIDPDALRRVVTLLKAAFNIVVIDTSKGLQASDFVAFEMADTILLVVELDLSNLRNSARLLQFMRQVPGMVERVRVIVNRAGSSISEISLKKAEETLNIPVSWQIPNAYKVVTHSRSKGVTVEAEAPNSRVHRSIVEIAKAFKSAGGGAPPVKERRSRFAAFFL